MESFCPLMICHFNRMYKNMGLFRLYPCVERVIKIVEILNAVRKAALIIVSASLEGDMP